LSWTQKLYQTYDRCAGLEQFAQTPLLPLSHVEQQAHLEIILDGEGKFLGATVLLKQPTLIPVTEKSAGRSMGPAAHGLCDKLKYVARDYVSPGGKNSWHALYLHQLRAWASAEPDPKVVAILKYVEGGRIIEDLVRERILPVDYAGKLLTHWSGSTAIPEIFKTLAPKDGERDPGEALVRWRVKVPGVAESAVWRDPDVHDSWIRFEASRGGESGLCMVSGTVAPLAVNHPKRLRHGADAAKLVSSNDDWGYTFRGRFSVSGEAYSLSSIVTQKAHNALRWLIARQGYRQGDQAVVAWAVGGQSVPQVVADTNDLGGLPNDPEQYEGDVSQAFAKRLNKQLKGYAATLTDRDDIVVMAVDSATPGRMAITYYRELTGSEYIERLRAWHEKNAWPQNMGKDRRFIGAPAPRDIAEAAYGRHADEKLRKSTVERLLPSIVDGCPIPMDLVRSCARRAVNRVEQESWEWERTLGVACALIRGSREKKGYKMALEEDRNTRDYLFGRLLAVAERVESYALYLQGQRRITTVERLMQRFADHPAGTWRIIELALHPYMARRQSSRGEILHTCNALLDQIFSKFEGDDFIRPGRLDAEFLLGYHCQRAVLASREKKSSSDLNDSLISETGDN
jgi:CRISPR-associated protein Csd1